MTTEELERRVLAEGIVSLAAAEWGTLEGALEEIERHDTFISGDLVIGRYGGVLVAVEEPAPDKRVLRHLADEAEARRFVKERLDTYERMWDGCGCKVDYFR